MVTLPVKSVSVMLLLSAPVPLVMERLPQVLRAVRLAALVLMVKEVLPLRVLLMMAVPVSLVSVKLAVSDPLEPERAQFMPPKVLSRTVMILLPPVPVRPKEPLTATVLVPEPTLMLSLPLPRLTLRAPRTSRVPVWVWRLTVLLPVAAEAMVKPP